MASASYRESRSCGPCGVLSTTPARTSSTCTWAICERSSARGAARPRSSPCVRSDIGSMITPRRVFASSQRPRLASVRWRLTAWVAVMMLASAAVTYVVVSHYVSQQLRGQIERDIGGDATQLGQSLQLSGARTPARVAAIAQRSLQGQPYDATATVLVVIVPSQ